MDEKAKKRAKESLMTMKRTGTLPTRQQTDMAIGVAYQSMMRNQMAMDKMKKR